MEALVFTNRDWTLLFVLLFLFVSCTIENKQDEKAKQIKKGMTKQGVTNIMGEPDKEDIVTSYPPYKERFYYFRFPPIFSDDIIVWFDSSGHVCQVSLPKEM